MAGPSAEAVELLARAASHAALDDAAESQRAADRALELFRTAGLPPAAAEAAYYAASARVAQGLREEARLLAREHLERCRAAGDRAGVARLLLAVAEIDECNSNAELQDALAAAKEACESFRVLGESRWQAAALLQIANTHLRALYGDAEDFDRATAAIADVFSAVDEALPLLRSSSDRRGEAAALHARALAAARADPADDFGGAEVGAEAAISFARAAASIFRELGMRRSEATELRQVAEWTLADDRPEEAMEPARDALVAFQEVSCVAGQALALEVLVAAALAAGDIAAAREAASSTAAKARSGGDRGLEGTALELLLAVCLAAEDMERALHSAKDAADAHEAAGDDIGTARSFNLMAQLYFREGKFDKALHSAESAAARVADAAAAGPNADAAREERALALNIVAAVHLAEERAEDAGKAVDGLVASAPADDQEALMRTRAAALLCSAGAQLQHGDLDGATRFAKEAQDVFGEIGDAGAEASCLHLAARVHLAREQYSDALAATEGARALVKQTGEIAREVGYLILVAHICTSMLIEGTRGLDARCKAFAEGRGRGKVLRAAKEAVVLARPLNDRLLLAFALTALARAQATNHDLQASLESGGEAMQIFRQEMYGRGEATALLLNANVHMVAQKGDLATMSVRESLALFQKAGDVVGEVEALDLLANLAMSGGPAIPGAGAAMAQAKADGGAKQETAPEAAISTRSTPPMDVMSLPLNERVKVSVMNLVLDAIGRDDIEEDRTLMETGMTSIASIMLRDRLQNEFPDIEEMDLTFVFDYPTIREITEFIVDALPDKE